MNLESAPIFVGGPHRSGTGLLRAVIGANSAVAFPPKEYQFFDRLGPPSQVGQREYQDLLRTVLAWPKVQAWGLLEEQVEAAISGADPVRSAYIAPLAAFAHLRGKPRFGDKTPYLERHFDTLLSWFGPSLRFVHILRDPLRTYHSAVHYDQFLEPPSPEEFALRWKLSLLQGLRCSRDFAESYLLLRYEDFVADPRSWTNRISQFCGLPSEVDAMLGKADAERVRNSSFAAEERSGRTHPGDLARDLAGPQSFSEAATLIEESVFPHAAALGYTKR